MSRKLTPAEHAAMLTDRNTLSAKSGRPMNRLPFSSLRERIAALTDNEVSDLLRIGYDTWATIGANEARDMMRAALLKVLRG